MSIIPDRLYKVKIFESNTVYRLEQAGLQRVDEDCDMSIEEMISWWVDNTQSLIVHVGPLNVSVRETEALQIHTRSIAVTYAPPVEQGQNVNYGQQTKKEVGKTAGKPEPCHQSSLVAVSDGYGAYARKIRIPVSVVKAVAVDAEHH